MENNNTLKINFKACSVLATSSHPFPNRLCSAGFFRWCGGSPFLFSAQKGECRLNKAGGCQPEHYPTGALTTAWFRPLMRFNRNSFRPWFRRGPNCPLDRFLGHVGLLSKSEVTASGSSSRVARVVSGFLASSVKGLATTDPRFAMSVFLDGVIIAKIIRNSTAQLAHADLGFFFFPTAVIQIAGARQGRAGPGGAWQGKAIN